MYDYLEYPEMDKVAEHLWIGPAWQACDPELLRTRGITHVVNLAALPTRAKEAGCEELVIQHNDEYPIPYPALRVFLAWMDKREADGDVVYVHCMAGISRTPSFVAAWFMHRQDAYNSVEPERLWHDAVATIRSCRTCVWPHKALKESIINFFREGRKQ